jgi:hypothetical protein
MNHRHIDKNDNCRLGKVCAYILKSIDFQEKALQDKGGKLVTSKNLNPNSDAEVVMTYLSVWTGVKYLRFQCL